MGHVRVGIPEGSGRIYAGPTLVAFGQGYFEQNGLSVELIESGGRRGSIPMLSEGALDVTPQGLSLEFVRAWDPECPFLMVADHGSGGGGAGGIVARGVLVESGALSDYADLRGKRIGLSPIRGDHDWRTFDAALQRGGLTFADVEIVICDFGSRRHEALAAGTIDLTTVGRPSSIAEGGEKGGFVVWKHTDEVESGPRQGRAVLFGYRFWSERPDEAEQFLTAYLQGLRSYVDAFKYGIAHDAVVDLLATQSGLSRNVVAAAKPSDVNPDGYVDVAAIDQELRWYNDQDLIPEPMAAERLVDHRYVEAALAKLGKYLEPAGRR